MEMAGKAVLRALFFVMVMGIGMPVSIGLILIGTAAMAMLFSSLALLCGVVAGLLCVVIVPAMALNPTIVISAFKSSTKETTP